MDLNIHHKIVRKNHFLTGALTLALLLISACQPQQNYSITFGGDIILGRAGKPIAADWQQLDLRLPAGFSTNYYAAALESPLTSQSISELPTGLGEMNLCASSEELSILTASSIDLVTFMNNHQDDCQLNGAAGTQKLLAENGFALFEKNQEVWIGHVSNSKLAIIAVEDVTTLVDENALVLSIQKEKQAGNLVVVSVHWGNEYQAGPNERQIALAQKWADAGADVIWGHHPHVLQRIDWLTSTKDGHDALVIYSLGNLMADQLMLLDAQRTALIRLDIVNSRIKKVTLLPAMFDWDTGRLKFDLDDETRDKILNRLDLKPNQPIEVDVYSGVN